MAPHNITYTEGIHTQQVKVQGQGTSLWSISHTPSGTVSVNNPLTFHSDKTHEYYPMLLTSWTKAAWFKNTFNFFNDIYNS